MKEVIATIVVAAALVVVLFGGAVWHWGTGSETTAPADEIIPVANRPVVPYTPLPESMRFHGVAIQVHNCDLIEQFKQSIREVAATGADTVLLSCAAYQDNASSSVISIDTRKAPTREQLADMIKLAKSLKMRVIVMPIVLLENPRGNEWRGRIIPEDPERWWADYREYMKFYGQAASEGGADLMMIGSELNRLEASVPRWKALIKFMRTTYPNLKLGYSANWDRYWKVNFWDLLDYAGVTSYYDLAKKEEPTPTVAEIEEAWHSFNGDNYVDKLVKWQRTVGKPVIFTEVGWYSRKGVSTRPWDYYYNAGKPSPQEQANLYQAFVNVWADNPLLGGIIFWEWNLVETRRDPKTNTDRYIPELDETYTPRGKPAERIMRDYFAQRRAIAATQPATQPDN